MPFTVAGKTGTAKIADSIKGYDVNDYNASFVGYFPAEAPKYTCIVVVTKPRAGRIHGGEVAAPIFRNIAINIYATNPSLFPVNMIQVPDSLATPKAVCGYSIGLTEIFQDLGLMIRKQGVQGPWSVATAETTYVTVTDTPQYRFIMPNLTGMTVKDASYLMEGYGIDPTFQGVGWVEQQHPAPGDTITGIHEALIILSTSRPDHEAIAADTAQARNN
jgi:cell division protein FtsI (penicillin-binding protein 3)